MESERANFGTGIRGMDRKISIKDKSYLLKDEAKQKS